MAVTLKELFSQRVGIPGQLQHIDCLATPKAPQSEPIRNDAGAAGMGAPAVGTSPAMGFPGGGNTYIPGTGRKRDTIGLTRMAYQDTEGNPLLYTTDAAGHEHKGAGPGGGQFTGHGGGSGTAEKKPKKKEKKGDADEKELPEWDGNIDDDEVEAERRYARGANHIASWISWGDDGEEYGNGVYLQSGTYDPFPDHPDSQPIDVYRWVSQDDDNAGPNEFGEWTTDRSQAQRDGDQYATDNDSEPPDPTERNIPENIRGQNWNRRQEIASWTDEAEDENEVRLDVGTFHFGGRDHQAYRWTTANNEDGDWTLDRDRAIEDGEEYAENNHSGEREENDKEEPPTPVKKRDVKLTDTELPKSRAKLITGRVDAGKLNALLGKTFGGTPEEGQKALVACLGMPDDADVTVKNVGRYDSVYRGDPEPGGHAVKVEIKHPKFTAIRSIGIDKDGKRFIVNHGFFVKDEYAGSGLGAEIFSKQVESACQSGIDYIATHAAKGADLNGYATWPKFGYDQSLTDPSIKREDARVYRECRERFPNAQTVQDVLRSPGGEEWWCGKKNPDGTRTPGNGTDMHAARFELDPDSRSIKTLSKYLEKTKAKKGTAPDGRGNPAQSGTGGGPGRSVGGDRSGGTGRKPTPGKGKYGKAARAKYEKRRSATPTQLKRHATPTLYHDFGCLLAPLYGEAQMAVLRAGAMVADADLAEDGREDSPHITARYGIHPEVTPEVVGELLAAHGIGPIRLKLGKVGCFPRDEYDVLYLTVESPDLRRIHQITAALPHTDTHPHYTPHATFAYVRPGLGKAYLGRIPAADLECEVPELEFHGPDSEGQGTAIAPE